METRMVISVEDAVNLLPTFGFQALINGEVDDLLRLSAIVALPYLNIGSAEPVELSDFVEIQRFGFFSFADDQDAVVTGALVLFSFKFGALPVSR